MSTPEEPMAYIARAACGCFKFAGVDTPNNAKTIAKEIAWAVRKGYTVDRVTCEFVRANWVSTCDTCTPPKRPKHRAATQGQLL